MSTLSKIAASLIGHLEPKASAFQAASALALPPPSQSGGLPLLDSLAARRSSRCFRSQPLPLQVLSTLLWAANGINRPDTGGRTAPSALNAREISIYAALSAGVYVYEPNAHVLNLVSDIDARRVTGYQDLVDDAPLDLIFVADHAEQLLVPSNLRSVYAAVSAGAVAQNAALYCSSVGLGAVVRGWFDRAAIAKALGLRQSQEVVLTQTVGYSV
jgi:SagB-type dehydrogenase family enzyme